MRFEGASCGQLLKPAGTLVSQRRMQALPVVKHLDVLEDPVPGLGPCGKPLLMNQLFLQRRKETFHDRVVVTVPDATHAARDPVFTQHSLKRSAGVWAPAIGMVQQFSRFWT